MATDTGRSIEDAAAEPDDPEGPVQLPIEGEHRQLSLDAGGDAPETSTIKMRGGSLALEGEFDKGSRVALWVECVIGEVTFADKHDQYGNVTGTERRHVARMIRVQRQ
jgi:hypothetical protein